MLGDGCPCAKCVEITDEKLEKARELWRNGTKEIVFTNWHWQCGDGCCDDYGTDMAINGFTVGRVEGDPEAVTLCLLEFLGEDIESLKIDHESEGYNY